MSKSKPAFYSPDEIRDEILGKRGTEERDQHELQLSLGLLGNMITQARQQFHMSREELGRLTGVPIEQILQLEINTQSVPLEIIVKVLRVLRAEVQFNVSMGNIYLVLI